MGMGFRVDLGVDLGSILGEFWLLVDIRGWFGDGKSVQNQARKMSDEKLPQKLLPSLAGGREEEQG